MRFSCYGKPHVDAQSVTSLPREKSSRRKFKDGVFMSFLIFAIVISCVGALDLEFCTVGCVDS